MKKTKLEYQIEIATLDYEDALLAKRFVFAQVHLFDKKDFETPPRNRPGL
jgi:hypothetical protein